MPTMLGLRRQQRGVDLRQVTVKCTHAAGCEGVRVEALLFFRLLRHQHEAANLIHSYSTVSYREPLGRDGLTLTGQRQTPPVWT